jgi:hypothetical protein
MKKLILTLSISLFILINFSGCSSKQTSTQNVAAEKTLSADQKVRQVMQDVYKQKSDDILKRWTQENKKIYDASQDQLIDYYYTTLRDKDTINQDEANYRAKNIVIDYRNAWVPENTDASIHRFPSDSWVDARSELDLYKYKKQLAKQRVRLIKSRLEIPTFEELVAARKNGKVKSRFENLEDGRQSETFEIYHEDYIMNKYSYIIIRDPKTKSESRMLLKDGETVYYNF